MKVKAIDSSYFLLVLYKLLVDLTYCYLISPMYLYAGASVNFSIERIVFSWLVYILLLPSIISTYKSHKVSSVLIMLLYLIYFIPSLTLYAFWMQNSSFIFYLLAYWLLIIVFDKYLLKNTTIKDISYLFKGKVSSIILFVIIIGTIIICGTYNGFKLHFSLLDVYDLRTESANMNKSFLVGYLQPLSSSIVPIAIVYYLLCKKRIYVVILVFIQLLNFAFGGARTTLFALPVAFVVYFVFKNNNKKIFILSLMGLTLLAFFEYYLSGYKMSFLAAYIYRRSIFTPIELSYNYYDFFQIHEHLYLRDSFLRWFGTSSPYNGNLARTIGAYYYGKPLMGCNNGLCGDAFANFGWLSLPIYPLLVTFAIKMLDLCSNKLNHKIIMIVSILFAVPFTNTSFFGLLLTNGYIITCIFLLFLPRNNKLS